MNSTPPRRCDFDLQEGFSPREHHDWCLRMWLRMDRDNSGFISRQELDCEEFRGILRKALTPNSGGNMGGPRYARAEMNIDQALFFLMRKADLNGDGAISFLEFTSLIQVLRESRDAIHTANMIFALFDLDSDGFIDDVEFREIFRFFLGHEPSYKEFQEEWLLLDETKSGKVTRSQYVAWLQTSQNPIFRWHSPDAAGLPLRNGSGGSSGSRAQAGSPSCESGGDGSPTVREPGRIEESWRPWHNYQHCAWHEPTKGKPSHTKMKFRDTTAPASMLRKANSGTLSNAGAAAFDHGEMMRRPDWNQRLATAHPNWPDKEGRSKQIVGRRRFFSRPQSLPELKRHLDLRPGLSDHSEAIFSKEKPRKPSVLSNEHDSGAAQILSVASRSKPGGYMRHSQTRERKGWNDHWYESVQLKSMYHPAPTTNIGVPARHLVEDLYEDET